MDVFSQALIAGRPMLRAAAIAAAREVGVFDALASPHSAASLAQALRVSPHRLSALLDVLAFEGVLARVGANFTLSEVPPVQAPRAREGWWRLAEVLRADRPLDVDDDATVTKFHDHLFDAGLAAARETFELVPPFEGPLVDLGGGAGAYVQAALEADPRARAVLVDRRRIVEHARRRLDGWGDRVAFVEGELPDVEAGRDHGLALLANVLHLHGARACEAIVAHAARCVRPGGIVAVKDLLVEPDRSGPAAGLYFALNMAIYTDEGATWTAPEISSWMLAAGLTDVTTQRLERTGEAMLVIGRRTLST